MTHPDQLPEPSAEMENETSGVVPGVDVAERGEDVGPGPNPGDELQQSPPPSVSPDFPDGEAPRHGGIDPDKGNPQPSDPQPVAPGPSQPGQDDGVEIDKSLPPAGPKFPPNA